MINFLKTIFSKKDNEPNFEDEKKESFKTQVEIALEKCIVDKEQEFKNIENVKKWAKDLIFEIFNVPSAYWYEELKEYENIKYHETNLSLSENLVKKTDLLIDDYREQLKLSKTKITFCDTLIKEYKEIINRYEKTNKKIIQIQNENNKLELIKKRKQQIDKLRSKTTDFQDIYNETSMLDVLHEDIISIEDDFKIKQEVTEYIESLDTSFTKDIDNTDSSPFRKEIEKLTSEIKTK